MRLFTKTFKNELGNEINLAIDDAPSRKSVIIRIVGPTSTVTHEITYYEASELREALRCITI